jgi:hypothetical protein
MRLLNTAGICVSLSLMTACDYPRVLNSDFSYSYISATETFASTRRSVGELFIIDPQNSDGRLEILDKSINFSQNDLKVSYAANIETSKITGAQFTIALDDNNKASGSGQLEAKVDADGWEIRSMTAADVSDKIEQLYTRLRAADPEGQELPLDARRVDEQGLLYAVVSGSGAVDKLLLSYGTPEGSENGVELTVNGVKYVDVKVQNRSIFECAKSDTNRPQCTADITVYSAKLKKRGDGQFFDVKPASVSKDTLTKLFQNTFSR